MAITICKIMSLRKHDKEKIIVFFEFYKLEVQACACLWHELREVIAKGLARHHNLQVSVDSLWPVMCQFIFQEYLFSAF